MPAIFTTVNAIEACDALRSHTDAWRKADELQTTTVARLAHLDQELAEVKDQVLAHVTHMTDCVVTAGEKILERLVLEARITEICAQAASTNRNLTSEEKAALASVMPASPRDTDAHRFVKDCGRGIEFCLEWIDECLDDEDIVTGRAFGKQANRLIAAMRKINDSWPWVDQDAFDQSWRQYRNDELMDFETFKHELLKAAQ